MKFILFVISGPNNPADSNEMKKIDAFNDKLQEDGHWIMAAGIREPEAATLIDNRGSKGEISDGSLFSGPEFYAGFWIIEADSEAKAQELAVAGSLACNRKVEVRPFIR